MTDPTEDIPADGPLGQGDGDLGLGALGPGVPGAVGIGATVEPTEQLDRPLERMEPPRPVVTDVPHPAAGRALPIQDVELPEGEVSLLGPVVGHRSEPSGAVTSIGRADQPRGYTCRSRDPSSVSADCLFWGRPTLVGTEPLSMTAVFCHNAADRKADTW